MYQFTDIDIKEFEAFSQNYPLASFVQSEAMALVHLDQNRSVEIYGVKQGDELIAAGLFSIRKVFARYTIAQCNQGPLIDYGNKELV